MPMSPPIGNDSMPMLLGELKAASENHGESLKRIEKGLGEALIRLGDTVTESACSRRRERHKKEAADRGLSLSTELATIKESVKGHADMAGRAKLLVALLLGALAMGGFQHAGAILKLLGLG